MKRLVSTVLALSLLGTVAASAQPYNGGYGNGAYGNNGGYSRGIQRNYRDNGWDRNRYGGNYDHRDYRDRNRGHNDGAALIGLGIGLFALAAIASSQHNSGYRGDDSYYYGR